jgi:hypothetical protein
MVAHTKAARTIAAVFLTASFGFAQSLAVKTHLTVGDAFTVEISHARSDPSRPQNDAKAKNTNQVRVLEAGPTGSLLEWIEGATEYDDPAQSGNPIVAGASKALDNLKLLVKLGPDGEYLGLQNDADVTKQLQAVVETVIKQVVASVPEEQRAGMETVVKQAMQPAALLASATRDIQLYFNLHAAELDTGKPAEASVQLPNPITGTPIPAKVKITWEGGNNLSVQTAFDGAAVQAAMAQLIAQAAPGSAVPTVTVEDGGRYVYEPSSGLMQSVVYTRRVKAGPQNRTDEWQLKLTKPPKR